MYACWVLSAWVLGARGAGCSAECCAGLRCRVCGAERPLTNSKQKFAHRAEEIASRLDGVMAYTIVDLTSGDRFDASRDATFPTASTIKLAIVYELFKQAEEGSVRLDETMVLDRAKAVGGTGVLVGSRHADAVDPRLRGADGARSATTPRPTC